MDEVVECLYCTSKATKTRVDANGDTLHLCDDCADDFDGIGDFEDDDFEDEDGDAE